MFLYHFKKNPNCGIYPLSEFNTPLGIYCYPIKESYEYYQRRGFEEEDDIIDIDKMSYYEYSPHGKDKNREQVKANYQDQFISQFPFAANNPHLSIFEAKNLDKVLYINTMSEEDIFNYKDKINNILSKLNVDKDFDYILYKSLKYARIKSIGR
jgi:hypothetical protein